MAEFETINRGGHTYKRRKGSRDQWIDENGNVVDLSTGKRRVTSLASARIGSGNNSANPDVWIVNGKAYSDSSHGGYKTSYFNAVKRLGQNLGWSVKVGSLSERNLKAQNKKFNASKSRLSSGKIGRITDDGKAEGYRQSRPSNKLVNLLEEDTFLNKLAKGWNNFWDSDFKIYDPESTGFSYSRTGVDPLKPLDTGWKMKDVAKVNGAALAVALLPGLAKELGLKTMGNLLFRGAAGSYVGNLAGTYGSKYLGGTKDELKFFGDIGSLFGGLWGAKTGFPTKSSASTKPTITTVVDEEAPLVATTPTTPVKGYLPTPKETIPSVLVEPAASNLKALPWLIEAKASTSGSPKLLQSKVEPVTQKPISTEPIRLEARTVNASEPKVVVLESTPNFKEFKLDKETIVPWSERNKPYRYVTYIRDMFKKHNINVAEQDALKNYALRFMTEPDKYRITNAEELANMRKEFGFKCGGKIKYFL